MSKKTKFRRISHYKKAERFLIKRVQVGKKTKFCYRVPVYLALKSNKVHF